MGIFLGFLGGNTGAVYMLSRTFCAAGPCNNIRVVKSVLGTIWDTPPGRIYGIFMGYYPLVH